MYENTSRFGIILDLNFKSESYFQMSNLAANYKCITFVETKAVLVLADRQLKDTN